MLVDADFFEVDIDAKGTTAQPAAQAPAAPKQVSNYQRYYYINRRPSLFNSKPNQLLQLLPNKQRLQNILRLPKLPQCKSQLLLSKPHLPKLRLAKLQHQFKDLGQRSEFP